MESEPSSRSKGKAPEFIGEITAVHPSGPEDDQAQEQGVSLGNPPPLPKNISNSRSRSPTKQQLVERNEDLLRRLEEATQQLEQQQRGTSF